jgi:hypothetical protein
MPRSRTSWGVLHQLRTAPNQPVNSIGTADEVSRREGALLVFQVRRASEIASKTALRCSPLRSSGRRAAAKSSGPGSTRSSLTSWRLRLTRTVRNFTDEELLGFHVGSIVVVEIVKGASRQSVVRKAVDDLFDQIVLRKDLLLGCHLFHLEFANGS